MSALSRTENFVCAEEASRASVTGGVQTPSKGLPEGTTKPGAPATAAGVGSEKKVESTEKKTEGGEEKKGESEAMVRSSYLPANKLKDAPPLEKYEGVTLLSASKHVGTTIFAGSLNFSSTKIQKFPHIRSQSMPGIIPMPSGMTYPIKEIDHTIAWSRSA